MNIFHLIHTIQLYITLRLNLFNSYSFSNLNFVIIFVLCSFQLIFIRIILHSNTTHSYITLRYSIYIVKILFKIRKDIFFIERSEGDNLLLFVVFQPI